MKIRLCRALSWLLACGPMSLVAATENPPAPLGSTVFHFGQLAVQPTPVGQRRDVARRPSATLAEFECHISTLNPDRASHPPHTHPQEELIVLREGTLDVQLNGASTRVGPGSLFFFAANNPHAVQNHGDQPATYFVFNFSTAATAALKGKLGEPPPAGAMASFVKEWTALAVVPTKTGERRDVCDAPTATLAHFECHVTTLRAGEAPHAPHRHPDEEIVLVKEGALDVTISGKTERAEAGAIVFVAPGDLHGWKNAADGATTYYVLRLKTEKTAAQLAD